MTGTLDLVKALTDDEWASFAPILTARFPTARENQRRPPGDWLIWLIMAGRGFGKTRTGAEEVVEMALEQPGDYFACAPTFRDMRLVAVEGAKSGLLAVLRRRAIGHTWSLATTTITLENGSKLICGSADEPDRWRGYNFRGGWCDEMGAWRRPDTFTQLRMATRMGDRPRIVITTTPRQQNQLIIDLATGVIDGVHVTRGRTMDNAANLSEAALEELHRRYGGTREGRQELDGELLLDHPGALWTLAGIDAHRHTGPLPLFDRVVVGVDPAVTSGEDSDLSGIVTVGKAGDHLFVLSDATGRYTPDGTARVVIGELDRWEADRIVGEVNNGGDYIGTVIHHADGSAPYSTVHASRGKRVRAEPTAALYEQGRVHHVGDLTELEGQLCSWAPDVAGPSPDRMDALVWAVTELTGERKRARIKVRR